VSSGRNKFEVSLSLLLHKEKKLIPATLAASFWYFIYIAVRYSSVFGSYFRLPEQALTFGFGRRL